MSLRERPARVCETYNTAEIGTRKCTYISAIQEQVLHTCLQEVIEILSIHSQIFLSGRMQNKQAVY